MGLIFCFRQNIRHYGLPGTIGLAPSSLPWPTAAVPTQNTFEKILSTIDKLENKENSAETLEVVESKTENEEATKFKNLNKLENALNELAKTISENNVTENLAEQEEPSSEQKKIIEKEKALTKAIVDINAIATFFDTLKLTETDLTITEQSSVEVDQQKRTILIEPEALSAICEVGIAYCGGILKTLKDNSIEFQNVAPESLLKLLEDIIFMRGEAAHTLAAKNSTIKVNDLLQINDNILPLLQVIVNNFKIQLLPTIQDFNSTLSTVKKQFDNTLGSAFSKIQEAKKAVGENFNKYINGDMNKLMSLYKAIDYYKNIHPQNQTKLENIHKDALKIPENVISACENRLSELDSIEKLVSEVEKKI